MALNIKSKETEALVRRLAAVTGESLTEAIQKAVEERLAKLDDQQKKEKEERWKRIETLIREIRAMPTLDDRSEDEILGYNDQGFFD